jgi:DNA repair protein RecN (Recombination protein N)
MLISLHIHDLAVIEHADIEFAPGLNVLTGETGSGKSIVVDALGLLLGNRADASAVRTGSSRALVSGVFNSNGRANACVQRLLSSAGLETENDQIVLRREVAAEGKSKAWIDDQPTTVTLLKEVAAQMADIHSQNQVLVSFHGAARLALLDAFAERLDARFIMLRAEVGERFAELRKWKLRLEDLEGAGQRRLQEADLRRFQCDELRAAQLRAGEDAEIEQEHRILANASKIASLAEEVFQLLYESPEAVAVALKAAIRRLQELSRIDASAAQLTTRLDAVRCEIEDVADHLRDRAASIEASPARLAGLEERLALLDRLKRKYGPTLDEVLAYAEEVEQKLDEFERAEIYISEAREQLAQAADAYLTASGQLSLQRTQAAEALAHAAERHANELATKIEFAIQVTSGEAPETWSESGRDRVEMLVATNPGEPLKPVEEIASGGESSRVLLALNVAIESGGSKRALAETAGANRTLVFDEIDSGVGGRAAEAIGQKLRQLAARQQILCVTHLPQIATFAHHHLRVEKRVRRGRAFTDVVVLDGEERVEEIARMLAGSEVNSTARKHAQEMLRAHA